MAKPQLLPYTPSKKLTLQQLPSTTGKNLASQALGITKAINQTTKQISPSTTTRIAAPEASRLNIDTLKRIDQQVTSSDAPNKQNQTGVTTPTQFDMNAFFSEMQRQNQASLDAQNQQQSDIEARINALNQAKQTQAVADFGKARDTQLSNLTGEEAGIKPVYYDKRNQAAASNMMGRRSLAEELAARGEAKSGVADEANIRANMSLQGETGLLNRQEAADISDIARRRTGVQNAYESDVASARAGLESAAMQNLINQYNADRQFKLQEAGLTGTYSGNQTLDALNAARNFSLNEAGLTGTYGGNQTLASQGQAFNQNMATQQFDQAKSQQEIDNVFRQTQTDIENALNNRQISNQEAQQLLENAYRDKTFAEQKRQFNVQSEQSIKQQDLDNLYRQQTFDYQKSRDAVGDSQWQQSMNLNLRQESFQEAQQKIENALSQNRISQEDASQALQWAKFNSEQDPNSLDNQMKQSQLDLNTQSKNTAALNDTIQRLDSLYTYQDESGVPTRNPNYTDTQLRSAIIGMNLSDDDTDALLLRYGLNIN